MRVCRYVLGLGRDNVSEGPFDGLFSVLMDARRNQYGRRGSGGVYHLSQPNNKSLYIN